MHIWGDKTLAFFDVWSIEHIVSGITLGSLMFFIHDKLKLRDNKEYKLFYYLSIAFVAYLWETIEHYLETGLINDQVTFWFRGVEFWGNRIITDPILAILGAFLYWKYNALGRYAQCFSAICLFFHIFIFPHSMYLQDKLAKLLA